MKDYKDLVKLVNMVSATGGMDVTNEAICEYQDMIGHSSIEQLHELANGKQKETFYRIYGTAYGTIAAIKFYCENSEKLAGIIAEHEEAREEAEERAEAAENSADAWQTNHHLIRVRLDEAEAEGCRLIDENARMKTDLEAARREIMELKAKLYDLMTK